MVANARFDEDGELCCGLCMSRNVVDYVFDVPRAGGFVQRLASSGYRCNECGELLRPPPPNR